MKTKALVLITVVTLVGVFFPSVSILPIIDILAPSALAVPITTEVEALRPSSNYFKLDRCCCNCNPCRPSFA